MCSNYSVVDMCSPPVELASQKVSSKVKVPTGTSDYQAAWIVESGEESAVESEEEEEGREGVPSPKEEESEEDEEEEDDMVSKPSLNARISCCAA